MDYSKICDNCIFKGEACIENIVYRTQKYEDLGIIYKAEVMQCRNYVPKKLSTINRAELREMAKTTYNIEKLVETLKERGKDK